MIMKIDKYIWCILFVLLFYQQNNFSQTDSPNVEKIGYPLIVDSDTLFYFYENLGPFSAEVRAREANSKIISLLKNNQIEIDSVNLVTQDNLYLIRYKSKVIFSISERDAAYLSRSSEELANEYLQNIKEAIFKHDLKYSNQNIFGSLGKVIGIILVYLLFLIGFSKIFPRIYSFIESLEGRLFHSISFRQVEVISGESIIIVLLAVFKLLRLFASLFLLYVVLEQVISILPWTSNLKLPGLRGIFIAIFITFFTLTLIKGINRFSLNLLKKIRFWKGTVIQSVRIKRVNLLSEDRIIGFLVLFVRNFKNVMNIVIGYFYITITLSLFEFTSTWSDKLLSYFLDPLLAVLNEIVKFIPNLIFIVIIIVVSKYIIKFIHFIFREIEKGDIEIPGFLPDWSIPTFKIFRFLIIVFAIIIIYPHLPGSNSKAFEGVSVLLGILLSLASASAISNIVSGTVLTYMNAFKLGDRVKIADTLGDVIEKTLLVTRIRTAKNVEIAIPNSIILSNHIINFSKSNANEGLILHTTVTIGYDVPWKKVHELLINAALASDGVVDDPKPFVLQTSLDDFYVSYELNAFTKEPNRMATIYSSLHQNIQDKFNEAGVEIMSPHYGAHRDGSQTTIPTEYLPRDYKAPTFNITTNWNKPKSE